MHINIPHCALHGKLGQITNYSTSYWNQKYNFDFKKIKIFLRPTDLDHIKEEPVNLSYYGFTQRAFIRPVCTFLQHQRDLNAQWRGWIWGSSSSTTSIQPTTPIPPSRFGRFSDVGASD